MNAKQEPTAGAMRAAKKIEEMILFGAIGNETVDSLASLIDAETGAAELLAALKLGPNQEHIGDERGPCLCSQCEFVRSKKAILGKFTL